MIKEATMTRYKVRMLYSDGTAELLDDVFDTYEAADAEGQYSLSCIQLGAEILHNSNMSDYPADLA